MDNTLKDYMKKIDQQATLQLEGLDIPVMILNVKTAFNRVDILVSPIGGSGEKWVSAAKVTI